MRYRNTREFPNWVLEYNPWFDRKGWPVEWQSIADAIYQKANEVAEKWKGVGIEKCPYNEVEVSTYLGADTDRYEYYPIFCCNKGYRPDEWDYLSDSDLISRHSRDGGVYEAKIGEWYLVCGFDYD